MDASTRLQKLRARKLRTKTPRAMTQICRRCTKLRARELRTKTPRARGPLHRPWDLRAYDLGAMGRRTIGRRRTAVTVTRTRSPKRRKPHSEAVSPSKVITACSHLFCSDCFAAYACTQVKEERDTEIRRLEEELRVAKFERFVTYAEMRREVIVGLRPHIPAYAATLKASVLFEWVDPFRLLLLVFFPGDDIKWSGRNHQGISPNQSLFARRGRVRAQYFLSFVVRCARIYVYYDIDHAFFVHEDYCC